MSGSSDLHIKFRQTSSAFPILKPQGDREIIQDIQDIIDAWSGQMSEWELEIPNDCESQELIQQAARLIKTCVDAGHLPSHQELSLENLDIRHQLQTLISLARPYAATYGFEGLDTDVTKAKFLKGITRCMQGKLNNWEKGLAIFASGIWDSSEDERGMEIMDGTYNWPAAIDEEGFELE